MDGIAGWYGRPQDPRVLEEMLAGLECDAHANMTWAGSHSAIGTCGRKSLCSLVQDGDVTLALCGHPRMASAPDAALSAIGRQLVSRYVTEGRLPLAELRGDFGLALVDEARERTILAIDRIGIATLSYTTAGSQMLFGTSLDVLARHPDCERRINPQAIYDYVYFHVVPGSDTIISGQRRVPPGCTVLFDRGTVRVERYWQMQFIEPESQDVEQESARFRTLLLRATRATLSGAQCGAFLSGGTDSSTVTGYVREATGQAPKTFSIGFAVDGFDEMDYARIAAKHFGTDHHEYYVTADDVAADAPRIARAYDQPFGNASALAARRG